MGLKHQLKTLSPYNIVITGGVEESVSSLDTNSTRSTLDSGHSRLSNLSELSFELKGLSRWGATTTDPRASYGFRTSTNSAAVVSPRQSLRRSASEASRRSTTGALHNSVNSDGSGDVTDDRWGSGCSRDASAKMPSQGLVAPKKPKRPQRWIEQLNDLPEEDEQEESPSKVHNQSSSKRTTPRSWSTGRLQCKMPMDHDDDDVGQRSERTALNQLSVKATAPPAYQKAATSDPSSSSSRRRKGRKNTEVDSSSRTESSRSGSRQGSNRRKNRDSSQKLRSTARQSEEQLSSSKRSSSIGRFSQEQQKHERPRQSRPVRSSSGDH